jgi:CheY-like chemotaxis protein
MTAPTPADLLAGLTLLVVDDNDDAAEVLSTFLRSCGADVLCARTAIGALTYVDESPSIDAVITDLAMPDMDGVELARRIRRHPSRKSHLPVIAVTGFYEQYVGSQEFDAFLKKPVDLDGLCATVAALARRGD